MGIEIKIFLSADTEKETQEWVQLIKELVLPEPKLYPSVKAGDIYGKCNTKLNFILDLKQFFKLHFGRLLLMHLHWVTNVDI